MRRSLRLSVTEVEALLRGWALEYEYLAESELAVVFRVNEGQLTSVEMSCDEDPPKADT